MKYSSLCLFFLLLTSSLFTQAELNSKTLKVYINCDYCYQSYLRTQITWVDFVQDQFVSDIDMMVSTLSTGSGGDDYKLYFTGKNEFAGMTDTLHFITNGINTDAEVREMLAQRVKLGLVRYAAKTGLQEVLMVNSSNEKDEDDIGIGSNPEDDPWNAWVIRLNGNANANAQKVFQNGDFSASINASQVKESHKLNLRASGSYSEQRFNLDGVKSSYILRSQYGSASYVHSLSSKWSAGIFSNVIVSNYSNYDYYQNASLAVEYNIFPYKDAQTKLITLSYSIGGIYFDFQDTTIYNKTSQMVPTHGFTAGSSFTQKWGSFSGGLSASSFLDAPERYRYGSWLNFNIRIFKGLSLNSYMSFNVVRDQINIRKAGASDEEVLLQQKELQTGYNFNTYLGLSYRFGSIYNNVVNPRFDNSN